MKCPHLTKDVIYVCYVRLPAAISRLHATQGVLQDGSARALSRIHDLRRIQLVRPKANSLITSTPFGQY